MESISSTKEYCQCWGREHMERHTTIGMTLFLLILSVIAYSFYYWLEQDRAYQVHARTKEVWAMGVDGLKQRVGSDAKLLKAWDNYRVLEIQWQDNNGKEQTQLFLIKQGEYAQCKKIYSGR